MVLPKSAVLLVVALFFVLAQSWDTETNLTIKLFPSDAEDKCDEGGKGGLTITTETVPRHLVCIDIEKMFGSDQRVGFLNDSTSHNANYGDHVDVDRLPPPGIDWYIPVDSVDYDSTKNWTNIWFEQRNQTSDGESEEGLIGRWIVTTWANNKCEKGPPGSELPWFETSCQTSEDGQCEPVPYSIKGIGIRPHLPWEFDDCQTWAQTGAAVDLLPRVSAALVAFAMASFLL